MYKYNLDFVHPLSKESFENEIRRSRLTNKSLKINEYHNAIIDDRAEKDALVLDTDSRYIKLNVQEYAKECVFLGYFVSCWGHILTDGFKRLWFFKTEYCQTLLRKDIDFVYVTSADKDVLSANIELLKLIGIDFTRFKKLTKATKYDKIIVPEDCFWGGIANTTFTKDYVLQIEDIRNYLFKHAVHTYDKVYFTRSQLGDSREVGEKVIEKEFRKLGYNIFAPEKLAVKEQLDIVSHCKYFAATEGSIAHISLFCQPGTHVTIIRKADYTNGYQLAINEVANLDVTYVDAHESYNVSTDFPWTGPFYLCVNSLFEHFVGHKIPHIPYFCCPSWWWYMNKNRKIIHKIQRLFNKYRFFVL